MNERLARAYDTHGDKLRFLVVGAWNTLFSLAVIWLLDRMIPYDSGDLLHKQGILFIAWIISVTQNFLTFKYLVFHSTGSWWREYLRMYVTYAVVFVVQSALTLLVSEVFELRVFWASVPVTAVVMMMSYVGHKYFTFRDPSDAFEGRPGE